MNNETQTDKLEKIMSCVYNVVGDDNCIILCALEKDGNIVSSSNISGEPIGLSIAMASVLNNEMKDNSFIAGAVSLAFSDFYGISIKKVMEFINKNMPKK